MNAPEPRLAFRAEDHTYWLGTRRLPSVSEVIAPINPFANGPIARRYLEPARDLGTAVHFACQLHDEGDLDEASVDPVVRPYLEAWRGFLAARVAELLAIETPFASLALGFAGTPDRVARLASGHLALLDLKSGAPQASHAIQLAAYAELAGKRFDVKGKRVKRFTVQLQESGKFRLYEYKAHGDWGVFLACLSIWRWREANR